MANIEVQGIIRARFPIETFGTFRKQVIWLEEKPSRTGNVFAVEFHAEGIDFLKTFNTGDAVLCKIEVVGKVVYNKARREDMQFNTLKCFDIERVKLTG